MPTHPSEIFIYDNIHFENGRRDQNEHPVIIAGVDEENAYCFAMTSQTKHLGKNSITRNQYNTTIKYAETIPGKNCTTNNFMRGLVNTSHCIVVPLEQAKQYPKFGIASGKLLEDIIAKWAFQQNEIVDKKDFNYELIHSAFDITESIKLHPAYRACQYFADQNPSEITLQREYYTDLRKYREECIKIRRQNTNNYYRGESPLPYPKEPKLKDDKSMYEMYSTRPLSEEEQLANSPFAGLADKLFGAESNNRNEPHNVIDFDSRKKELLDLKQMLQESQVQELQQENTQESHHGRRAA